LFPLPARCTLSQLQIPRDAHNKLSAATTTPLAAPFTESKSASLRKELGFTDLILASILSVIVPDLFGVAAKAGSFHLALWLLAIILFFVPQALVVGYLNRRMPMEGGLYEWVRHAFGDVFGFLVAWYLWLFGTLYVATVGLLVVTYVTYAAGLDVDAVVANKWLVVAASIVGLACLTLLAHIGLRVGKWVLNFGGVLTILIITFLAAIPFFQSLRGALPDFHPWKLALPPLSLVSVSIFTKMTFGALCGLEYCAIFGGESRNAGRHLTRAVFIAAPIIALFYILGTSAILAYVPPDKVDLIGPIPQALNAAVTGSSLATAVVPLTILILLGTYLANFSLNFAANTRLPLCAGWDHLLPKWFTRLHPKYRTPVNSTLFLSAVAMLTGAAVLAGVGQQEAFALLQNWTFTFYGMAYLGLFAIPLLANRSVFGRPPIWLRILALSGLLVTLLFVLLSIFPIIPVANQTAYTAKTIAVLVGANLAALLLYRFRPNRPPTNPK
jgi:amino acid transporter